ncbi:transmembrane protein 220-like isoform X1 [Megalobrama amblycephala]|uniref:transmembrane protein 220-like isoform X1 n=1 Tax=Megalobrama amblycephala TaxID=75352 RepID=UPI0020145AD8|nr:transmembrane protein 220-like isoform X1 [Megalobrama amblycephala]
MKNKIRVSFSQIIWRVCNLFMSVFFSLATYAQINDPDAALWMVGYAVPAGLCFLICCEQQITGGNYRYFPARGRKVTIIQSFEPRFSHIRGIKQIYFTGVIFALRECCGLLLTVFWLLLCRHSGRSPVGSVRICTAVGITVFPFITWIYYYMNTELRKHWPEHCTTAL